MNLKQSDGKGQRSALQRNRCIGLDIEVHDLAMKLGEHNGNFKPASQYVPDDVDPIYDDVTQVVDERRVFLTEGRPIQKRNQHPMLRPTAVISAELEKTDESYIRRPEEAVISKVVESHGTKQSKQDEIVMDPRDDAYESHRSITKSPAAISMIQR